MPTQWPELSPRVQALYGQSSTHFRRTAIAYAYHLGIMAADFRADVTPSAPDIPYRVYLHNALTRELTRG